MKELAKVEILRTDGRREEHEVGKHILLPWIKRMIGAEVTDSVNLRDGRVMICDDNGWETVMRPGCTWTHHAKAGPRIEADQ